ncbi:hypothetical protein LCGC14_1384930 [marine sediment metagenome]|uniref:Uncharacterized protein n=1 Tax=marine sediment metagenome TaxID=412755 RepID=A0A0F9K1V0_9ZZZZ
MVKKLYSITDWDYHQGKVTFEDLVDEDLNVIVTVCTVAIAKEEYETSSSIPGERATFTKEVLMSSNGPMFFILGEDNIWDIYLDAAHFTVQDIQKALDELSKLTGITYQFTSEPPLSWYAKSEDLREDRINECK